MVVQLKSIELKTAALLLLLVLTEQCRGPERAFAWTRKSHLTQIASMSHNFLSGKSTEKSPTLSPHQPQPFAGDTIIICNEQKQDARGRGADIHN